MDWMNQLGGLLGQYQGAQQGQPQTGNVEQDFQQFSQAAPNSTVAEGLSAAFRSNQTPAFGNMVGQLFGQANGYQRAGMLNTLMAAVGPMVLQQIMSRAMSRGGGSANMGGGQMMGSGNPLGALAGMFGGGSGGSSQMPQQITPEMAEQIPPQAVEEIAAEAEKHDPSIVDRISGYAAENPEVVKGLGAVAMTVALAHLANQYMDRS